MPAITQFLHILHSKYKPKTSLTVKKKFGFNLVFAIIAFSIGLALLRDFDFASFTFKQPVLNSLYLVTFLFLLFFTFRKDNGKNA